MSRAALETLRADLNPRGFGVLWDQAERWMATTPDGRVLAAPTPDALRRAVREVDGTTRADTAALPLVCDQRAEEGGLFGH